MKHAAYNFLKITLLLIIYSFLLINIYYSQKVSPLYFSLIGGNKTSVVSFLQKIKNLPVFNQFLSMNSNIYGPLIKDEINRTETARKENITKLESLLEKNPKSRDVLYDLYLLYKEEGNNGKAVEYLNRAREIDPTLK